MGGWSGRKEWEDGWRMGWDDGVKLWVNDNSKIVIYG